MERKSGGRCLACVQESKQDQKGAEDEELRAEEVIIYRVENDKKNFGKMAAGFLSKTCSRTALCLSDANTQSEWRESNV